jgi:hypothetical protein
MLLTQNKKIKSSSTDSLTVYNFGIPAFKSETGIFTCLMAGVCVAGCYAKSGAYVWGNVKQAYEKRLAASLKDDFVDIMSIDIRLILAKKSTKNLVIRIHDSGDFYSLEYFGKWFQIMNRFPQVKFYAYTKMVEMFKGRFLPSNFTLIFSLGGKQDALIDQVTDRHSRVFETVEELELAGYVNASHDDMLALTQNGKVGLVYHGAKSFKNTSWGKVAA